MPEIEGNRPGGEAFTTRPPVGGPSVPGDPDSLVDVESPDDFGMDEVQPDRPEGKPARRTKRGPSAEYWPEPLRGSRSPRGR